MMGAGHVASPDEATHTAPASATSATSSNAASPGYIATADSPPATNAAPAPYDALLGIGCILICWRHRNAHL
jgi:hypothetical protein